MEEAKLLHKLRHMMDIANRETSNPAEAANAAALAADLMLKYNINEDQLKQGSQTEIDIGGILFFAKDKKLLLQIFLSIVNSTGKLYGVKPILVPYPVGYSINFVGRKENRLVAESWIDYLKRCAKKAYHEWEGSGSITSLQDLLVEKQASIIAFNIAFNIAVATLIEDKYESLKKQTVITTTGNALVAQGWYDQEVALVEDWLTKKISTEIVESDDHFDLLKNIHATAAGVRAGLKVNMAEQLTNSAKTNIIKQQLQIGKD